MSSSNAKMYSLYIKAYTKIISYLQTPIYEVLTET